jgi:uncharacterized membrane protein
MLKFTGKQWVLIAVCFAIAVVLNWLIWYLAMGNPSQIGAVYHVLTALCLACAFIVIGDRFAKTQIFK